MYQNILDNIKDGNLEKIKNIHDIQINEYNEFEEKYGDRFFICCCEFGRLDIAKWLFDLSLSINSPIDITKHMKYIGTPFLVCCKNGNLDLAKWIWNLSIEQNKSINIHFDKHGNSIWVPVCCSGQLEVAKWLWNLSKEINSPINLHIGDVNRIDGDTLIEARGTNGFIYSCLNGHLEMAKWLYELSNEVGTPYDIYKGWIDDNLFIDICVGNNENKIEMLEWLWDISVEQGKPYDLYEKKQGSLSSNYNLNAFEICCKVGHLEVAKRIYEFSVKIGKPFNIFLDNNLSFRTALYCGHYDIVKWLIDLSKQLNKKININPNNTCKFIINDDDFGGHNTFLYEENILPLLNESFEEYNLYTGSRPNDIFKVIFKGEKKSSYFQENLDLCTNNDLIEI